MARGQAQRVARMVCVSCSPLLDTDAHSEQAPKLVMVPAYLTRRHPRSLQLNARNAPHWAFRSLFPTRLATRDPRALKALAKTIFPVVREKARVIYGGLQSA